MQAQQQNNKFYLWIEGKKVFLSADYCMRWTETSDGHSYPILYYKGKRVVKNWTIDLFFNSPEDEFGGNANTN